MSFISSAQKWFVRITTVFLTVFLVACGSVPEKQNVDSANGRIKQDIPPAAEQNYRQVLAAIDKQDWVGAESLLLDMQTQYPQLLSVPSSLAWVYWQQGKADLARATLEPLIGDNRLFKPDAYNTLAVIYREQGLFDRAQSLYIDALSVWPNDADLHINLGILYDLYLGRLPEALTHYRQANSLMGEKNKQLGGWIKDLERRIK